MMVLGWAVGLLVAVWMLHLLLWRVRLPDNHTLGLLLHFTLAPFLLIALALAVGLPAPDSWVDWLTVVACYYPCTLCYIIFYSTLEYQSPTCAMVLMIHHAGTLEHATLTTHLDAGNMMTSRLESMVQTGLAARTENGFTLTSKGKRMAHLFDFVARLFGIVRHGG